MLGVVYLYREQLQDAQGWDFANDEERDTCRATTLQNLPKPVPGVECQWVVEVGHKDTPSLCINMNIVIR